MRKGLPGGRISRVLALALGVGVAAATQAGSVALWPEAVVTGDEVRVLDLCQLRALEAAEWARVADLVVTPAPAPGGSAVVSIDDVRRTLQAGGVNLADVVLKGAAHCAVRRPQQPATATVVSSPGASADTADAPPAGRSLRQAVESFLAADLGQTTGRVDVQFGRIAGGVLELREPEYQFEIVRSSGRRLGLVALEISVMAGGETVQQVPLVVNVSFVKPTVVAAQAINLGATVAPTDVRVVDMTFTRLEHMGAEDPAAVIGQRAKRFIGAGQVVLARDLESVPLVKRGQIVSVYAQSGGVSIVTAAKAMSAGAYGDAVELRTSDRSKEKFMATVTGPARVRVSAPPDAVVAMGEGR